MQSSLWCSSDADLSMLGPEGEIIIFWSEMKNNHLESIFLVSFFFGESLDTELGVITRNKIGGRVVRIREHTKCYEMMIIC